MTKEKLQQLVDTAVALHREINTKTEQLKLLKADLVEEAKLHPHDFENTPSGGTRWTAQGHQGCIARVSFPAAALLSELDATGELTGQCKEIAGAAFRLLFTPVKTYHPVDNFRTVAEELLTPEQALALITACETAPSPRVSFETAKPTKKTTAEAPAKTPAQPAGKSADKATRKALAKPAPRAK